MFIKNLQDYLDQPHLLVEWAKEVNVSIEKFNGTE